MVSRSLKVRPDCLEMVSAAYEETYNNSRCSSELEFALSIPLPVNTNRDKKNEKQTVGMSRDTLKKFLKGEAIDRPFFYAICDRIGKKESDIGITGDADPDLALKERDSLLEMAFAPELRGGELARVPGVIDAEYVDVKDTQQDSEQGAESTSKISIKQDIDTLEGLAVGHSPQTNRASANETTQREGAPNQVVENSLDVKQTVRVVKRSGILIGSTEQLNIPSDEQSE